MNQCWLFISKVNLGAYNQPQKIWRYQVKQDLELHFWNRCRYGYLKDQWVNSLLPYGNIDLGQHWLRWWLVAWQPQAITWTNVDLLSVRSNDIHLRTISQEISQLPITEISFKITYLKFRSNLSGTSELIIIREGSQRLLFICLQHLYLKPAILGPLFCLLKNFPSRVLHMSKL